MFGFGNKKRISALESEVDMLKGKIKWISHQDDYNANNFNGLASELRLLADHIGVEFKYQKPVNGKTVITAKKKETE